jgi:hypothetical protein
LRKADPWTAAMHFKGLMDHDLVERRLLGAIKAPDLAEVQAVAAKGVDVFLAAYGPDKDSKAKGKKKRHDGNFQQC